MRVLSVASTGEPGGAELALATHLRNRPQDVEPRVVALSEGPLEELLARDGVPVSSVSLAGLPTMAAAARFEASLYRELRRLRPDVIHAIGNKAAVLALPAAIAARVPLIWQKVDLSYGPRAAHAVAVASRGVIAVSRAAAAGVPRRRLLGIVPPPVALPSDFRVDENRPPATLGSIGRLWPIKGHHHVLEAAAALRSEFPDVRVLVAGAPTRSHPDYPAQLRSLAGQLGLDGCVEVLGHVERIETVLTRLAVYVSATYRDSDGIGFEGFGGATVEASWAGLPVVATWGGGSPEAVQDGLTGRLVPPEQPTKLAEAIASYLRDPNAARAAGSAGAALARERYAPAPLAERLFAYLREAVRHRSRVARRRA